MNLLEKVTLLINAKLQSTLPHRERYSPLDKADAERLAEIRQAIAEMESLKQNLTQRLQTKIKTDAGKTKHDYKEELAEHSKEVINLEESLTALEERLVTLKAEAIKREQAAEAILSNEKEPPPQIEEIDLIEDEAKLSARKARLSA